MTLVKLCNTVNRIGVSLFHTHMLFVKVINQLESKICTTKHTQTLTFENKGQIMFDWYMLSLRSFVLLTKTEYVHIIHCKENLVYLSSNNFLNIPSVLFLLYSVTPVDLFLHWLKVELYVFVWYLSKQQLYTDVCYDIKSMILNNGNSHFSWSQQALHQINTLFHSDTCFVDSMKTVQSYWNSCLSFLFLWLFKRLYLVLKMCPNSGSWLVEYEKAFIGHTACS